LDIFLPGFSLSSCSQTQSEGPLAPKSHVSLKLFNQLRTEFFHFSYFYPD
jgi:hypothetical protein